MKVRLWRFFFFAEEGHEPMHVHCKKGDADAKYWLDPEIFNAKTYEEQFAATQLTRLLAQAEKGFAAGLGKPMKDFLKEFTRARKIPD